MAHHAGRGGEGANPGTSAPLELGNLGDHKTVGGGVWEARVTFGPGYRIYFGKDGHSIVVLLLGGDKGSQSQDIRRAQRSWADYLEREGPSHGTAQ